jgi:hypothetical protein
MKNYFLPFLLLVSLLALPFGQVSLAQFPGEPGPYAPPPQANSQKVQLALILDTSGSMKELLEQAKGELWYMVNEVMDAYEGYAPPQLEIALLEYGQRRAGKRQDFVRIVVPFTTDLDWVGQALFDMRKGGRKEFTGVALQTAQQRLRWSPRSEDLKFIFIAGNERFEQGPVSARVAIQRAVSEGISIHTIFAGEYRKGMNLGWKAAADWGQGEYFALEDGTAPRVPYYPSNYGELASLNRRLYETYLPYGPYGTRYWDRYCMLDDYAWRYGYGAFYWRLRTKTYHTYCNPRWDLVDAIRCGYVSWEDIPRDQLPREVRDLEPDARNAYLKDLQERRQTLLTEIRGFDHQADLGKELQKPAFRNVLGKAVRNKVEEHKGVLIRTPNIPAPTPPANVIPVSPTMDDRLDKNIPSAPDRPSRGGDRPVISNGPLRTKKAAPQGVELFGSKEREEAVSQEQVIEQREERLPQERIPQEVREERSPQEGIQAEREARARQEQLQEAREERARQERIQAEREARARQEQLQEAREERARQERIQAEREERARQQQLQEAREERARQERIQQLSVRSGLVSSSFRRPAKNEPGRSVSSSSVKSGLVRSSFRRPAKNEPGRSVSSSSVKSGLVSSSFRRPAKNGPGRSVSSSSVKSGLVRSGFKSNVKSGLASSRFKSNVKCGLVSLSRRFDSKKQKRYSQAGRCDLLLPRAKGTRVDS